MGEVINLNKFRKERNQAEQKATARQNRAKFGRTKVEKTQKAALVELDDKRQDDHELAESTNPEDDVQPDDVQKDD